MNAKLKAAALLAFATAGVALYSAAGVNAGNVAKPDQDSIRLRDGAGAVLNVGSKHAVAYYLKDANTCRVSVIVSETYPEQIPYNIASVRFTAYVQGGTSTQLATSDGSALSLSCAANAKSLSVESHDTVAWAATN